MYMCACVCVRVGVHTCIVCNHLVHFTVHVRYAIFFLQTRIAIPRYFSQSYVAYFKYIIHVHVHVHTRTVNVSAMLMISYVILKYAPYDWLKCNPRLQKKNRVRYITQCTEFKKSYLINHKRYFTIFASS